MLKADITAGVARCLIDTQFPHWSSLWIRKVAHDGWDNTTFRLGDDMSIRMPSADWYIPQVEKEHRWLPLLAPQLPVDIPRPVAKGVPGCAFPRPWSVYGWLAGRVATKDQIGDLELFAQDLAEFLRALQAVPTAHGPAAGAHSFNRGGPVQAWEEQTLSSISEIAGLIDAERAKEVWSAAAASVWTHGPVWVHGDVTPSNLLVIGGRLSGVLDFGCSAVGDPACDLTIAWTLLDGRARAKFQSILALDSQTWDRGRGWALWKASVTYTRALRANENPDRAGNQFGWSRSPRQVIEELLAEAGR